MTFSELGVREDLVRAITEMGFVAPMPVQEKVIPHLLNEDSDVVALAQTGTGKTAAFGLPVLQRINIEDNFPQALILSPTRELCLQIAGDLADYSKYIPHLTVLPVYGGSSIESQIRALRNGVQIIVATPGRLLDLLERKTVNLDQVHTVILDEADEMLNMGFVDDINSILENGPEERKMLLFSATMPREIANIAARYMRNPTEYVVGSRNEGAENVRHIYFMVKAADKYLALKRVVDYHPNIYGIIFCRTRRDTQEIADHLMSEGYDADSLHGDLSQAQRDTVMKKFRERNLQLLVATDVAARGLDVDDLTHVINFGLPDETSVYTHRSVRTVRAGKNGVSISIVHSREKGKIKDIEKSIQKKFERMEVPQPKAIIEKQLYNLADRIEKVEVQEDEIAKYLPGILRKLTWLSGEDLLKRVLSIEFNRLLNYYKDAPNVENIAESGDRKGKREPGTSKSKQEKDRRTAEAGYERVYVNAGKADGFFAQNIIEIINRNVSGDRVDIGRIDLMTSYSLFDVRQGEAKRVIKAMKGHDFFGKRLFAEIAVEGKDYAGRAEKAAPRKRKKDSRDDQPKHKKDERDDSQKHKKDERDDQPKRKKHESEIFSNPEAVFEPEHKSRRERRVEKSKKNAERKTPQSKYHGNFDKFKKRK